VFSRYVAIRYLTSSRENRFVSWITLLSFVGLAIGVAALIVVLSVINGFESELHKRFLNANAHIMAYRYPAGMTNPEKWGEILKGDFPDDIKDVSPFVHAETMLKRHSIMHGVLVRGISPHQREKVQSIRELVTPPTALDELQQELDQVKAGQPLPDAPGLIIGSGLLGIIDAKVGDVIQLLSPSTDQATEMHPFRIIGVYNSGLKTYDNRLTAISLPAAKRFFKMGDVVTGLEIGLYKPMESVTVTAKLQEKHNLTFREWQSFSRPMFEAMEQERVVIALIVAMVVLVAGFNILTTIYVSVSQKQKDISIMKALGARNNQIVQLFVKQGIYIGMIGSVAGVILAFAISKALQKYQFIELPEPYLLRSLPVQYSPVVYAGVALSSVAICIMASLYPAIVASRVTPTEGIRGIGQAI